jgi:hypothetical protein
MPGSGSAIASAFGANACRRDKAFSKDDNAEGKDGNENRGSRASNEMDCLRLPRLHHGEWAQGKDLSSTRRSHKYVSLVFLLF